MKGYKVQFYKATDGWRWRLKSGNGRIVAESGEAYTNHSKCVDGWYRVRRNTQTAVVID